MSELPASWAWAEIQDITSPFSTVDPRRTPLETFRYVDIGSIDNSSQSITEPKTFLGRDAPSRARRVIKSKDILFSTVRTYLRNIAQVPDDLDGCLTSTGIAVLRAAPEIDPRYMFHWVCSDEFVNAMSLKQDGSLYPAVTDDNVSGGRIPLAPADEQRRIVAKLDALLAGVARARKELDRVPILIAQHKQALLAAAFSGELTREWREERGASVEAWSTTTLGEFVDEGPSNGWSPPSSGSSTGALSLKLTATTSGSLRLDENAVKRIDETPPRDSKFWLRSGDVLIQRANSLEHVGACAIFDGPESTYIYPDLMMRVRVYDPMQRRYLWRLLNSEKARAYFRANATGSAGNMPKINGATVRALQIPLPPPDELEAIVTALDNAFQRLEGSADQHVRAARLLPKLEQAILTKAFRGELVPQDPADEPASVLLQRIRAEREACIKVRRVAN